jgi:hypothetical protein
MDPSASLLALIIPSSFIDSCPPCRNNAPIFAPLSENYCDIAIIQLPNGSLANFLKFRFRDVINDQERIIEDLRGLRKRNAMLDEVAGIFGWIPFKLYQVAHMVQYTAGQ